MTKIFLPHKRPDLFKKVFFWLITIVFALMFLATISVAGLFVYFSIGLPDVTDLEQLSEAQSTTIYDRDGNLLYTIHGEENRQRVSFENISQYLKDSTVVLEDADFYNHPGFDIIGVAQGVIHEATGLGKQRGGSTITQQYIKNTFLSAERTVTRKAKELILSIRLEKAFDKDKILDLYLNRIPYGNNAYGIQKASEIYFDTKAKDLTLAQSVTLASMPQAPSRYNPYGNNRYSHLLKDFPLEELKKHPIKTLDDLEQYTDYTVGLIGADIVLEDGSSIYIPGRTDAVLSQLIRYEKITEEEKNEAKAELKTLTFNNYTQSIKYPHFVLYIKQQLEDKYGKDYVERGGLKVYTTIDSKLQDLGEKLAKEKGDKYETEIQANNVSIFTINPKTGEILAMVGSRDYYNEEIDGNVNIVLRPRQPGSSFKPFVYAASFYNNYAPASVTYDIPMKLGAAKPQNYDGKFNGQMTLRRALAQSRNIPAIQAYYLAGEQTKIIDLVEKMGISSLDRTHSYGYPLALGAGEVSLFEMVKAYSVFANNGKKPEITGILKIENANGDILEEWKPTTFEEVLDPQIAYCINSILSDKENSIGPKLWVSNKIYAVKTGTSTKENKQNAGGAVRPSDLWTIGYSPSVVTGVWIGNSRGEGLSYNAESYNQGAPIFTEIMSAALKGDSAEPFPEPEGIKHVEISKISGKLPGPSTPASAKITDVFPSFSVPTETENAFVRVKIDKVSGLLATEYTPESAIQEVVFQNYEPIADLFNWKQELIAFYSGKTGEENGIKIGLPPSEYDNVHTAQTENNKPKITILNPISSSSLPQGAFKVELSIDAPNGIEKVEYYINDKLQYFTTTAPYSGYLNISKFMAPGSRQLIVAKAYDKLGYSEESAVEIRIQKDGDETTTSTSGTSESSSTTTTTTTTTSTTTPESTETPNTSESSTSTTTPPTTDTQTPPAEEKSVFDT